MDEPSDSQLLAGYVLQHDDGAFTALVRRHARVVTGACSRILGAGAEAEDAAQAVYVILARKAASLRSHPSLAAWLHRTAWHVATRARASAAARARRERQPSPVAAPDEGEDPAYAQLRPLLDRELDSLPDRYRVPLILHHVEGRSKREIAQLLGRPDSTISMSLIRGRDLLRERLERLERRARAAAHAQAIAALLLMDAPSPGASAIHALAPGAAPPHVIRLATTTLRSLETMTMKTIATAAIAFAIGSGAAAAVQSAHGPVVAPAAATAAPAGAPSVEARSEDPVEIERRADAVAYRRVYLPDKARLERDAAHRWVAIAGGNVVANADGRIEPCATLADADAAAGQAAPKARHRFVFEVGSDGDLAWRMGMCSERYVIGAPLLNDARSLMARQGIWFTDTAGVQVQVGFDRDYGLTLGCADPAGLVQTEERFTASTIFEGAMALTPSLAADLKLERWEIPGVAAVDGVDAGCRRANLRICCKEVALDRVYPVAIWSIEGHHWRWIEQGPESSP